MATIATRLSNTGTLLVNGGFDENTSITPSKFRTTSNTVFAGTLDEVSLAAGGVSFNGTNQYLTVPSSSAFNMTGDFTVESWMWIDSTVVSSRPDNLKYVSVFSGFGNTSGTAIFEIVGSASSAGTGLAVYQDSPSINLNVSVSIPLDSWVHIAFVRIGTTIYGFVNGQQITLGTSSAILISASGSVAVGRHQNTSYFSYMKGYVSNHRVVKGTALYTTNFTPPTGILPAVANTSLLLNVTDSTNFIKDNGPNKFTVTNNNSATFNTNGPFNQGVATVKQRQVTDGTLEVYSNFDEFTGAPVVDDSLVLWLDAAQTTSYPGTGTTWTDLSGKGNNGTLTSGPTYNTSNGGSIRFNGNGSGNYVSVSDSVSLRPANITVCTWAKFNSFDSTLTGVITKPQNSTVGGGWTNPYLSWMIRVEGTGTILDVSIGSASVYYGTTSAYSFSTNTWYLFTLTYDGTNLKGYVNTSLICSSSPGAAINYTVNPVQIGAMNSPNEYLNGYVSDAMIYNRALSSDEVSQNFNALRRRYGI
jgi:hypothetical protein